MMGPERISALPQLKTNHYLVIFTSRVVSSPLGNGLLKLWDLPNVGGCLGEVTEGALGLPVEPRLRTQLGTDPALAPGGEGELGHEERSRLGTPAELRPPADTGTSLQALKLGSN